MEVIDMAEKMRQKAMSDAERNSSGRGESSSSKDAASSLNHASLPIKLDLDADFPSLSMVKDVPKKRRRWPASAGAAGDKAASSSANEESKISVVEVHPPLVKDVSTDCQDHESQGPKWDFQPSPRDQSPHLKVQAPATNSPSVPQKHQTPPTKSLKGEKTGKAPKGARQRKKKASATSKLETLQQEQFSQKSAGLGQEAEVSAYADAEATWRYDGPVPKFYHDLTEYQRMQWNQEQDFFEKRRRKEQAAEERRFERKARSLLEIWPGDEMAEMVVKERIARGELRIEKPGKRTEEGDLIPEGDGARTTVNQMCLFLSGVRGQELIDAFGGHVSPGVSLENLNYPDVCPPVIDSNTDIPVEEVEFSDASIYAAYRPKIRKAMAFVTEGTTYFVDKKDGSRDVGDGADESASHGARPRLDEQERPVLVTVPSVKHSENYYRPDSHYFERQGQNQRDTGVGAPPLYRSAAVPVGSAPDTPKRQESSGPEFTVSQRNSVYVRPPYISPENTPKYALNSPEDSPARKFHQHTPPQPHHHHPQDSKYQQTQSHSHTSTSFHPEDIRHLSRFDNIQMGASNARKRAKGKQKVADRLQRVYNQQATMQNSQYEQATGSSYPPDLFDGVETFPGFENYQYAYAQQFGMDPPFPNATLHQKVAFYIPPDKRAPVYAAVPPGFLPPANERQNPFSYDYRQSPFCNPYGPPPPGMPLPHSAQNYSQQQSYLQQQGQQPSQHSFANGHQSQFGQASKPQNTAAPVMRPPTYPMWANDVGTGKYWEMGRNPPGYQLDPQTGAPYPRPFPFNAQPRSEEASQRPPFTPYQLRPDEDPAMSDPIRKYFLPVEDDDDDFDPNDVPEGYGEMMRAEVVNSDVIKPFGAENVKDSTVVENDVLEGTPEDEYDHPEEEGLEDEWNRLDESDRFDFAAYKYVPKDNVDESATSVDNPIKEEIKEEEPPTDVAAVASSAASEAVKNDVNETASPADDDGHPDVTHIARKDIRGKGSSVDTDETGKTCRESISLPNLSPRSDASLAIAPARSVFSESGISDAQSLASQFSAPPAPKLPFSWSAVASKGLHIPSKPVLSNITQAEAGKPKGKEAVKETEESSGDCEWSVVPTKKKEKESIKKVLSKTAAKRAKVMEAAEKQKVEEVPMFVTPSATATIPVPVNKEVHILKAQASDISVARSSKAETKTENFKARTVSEPTKEVSGTPETPLWSSLMASSSKIRTFAAVSSVVTQSERTTPEKKTTPSKAATSLSSSVASSTPVEAPSPASTAFRNEGISEDNVPVGSSLSRSSFTPTVATVVLSKPKAEKSPDTQVPTWKISEPREAYSTQGSLNTSAPLSSPSHTKPPSKKPSSLKVPSEVPYSASKPNGRKVVRKKSALLAMVKAKQEASDPNLSKTKSSDAQPGFFESNAPDDISRDVSSESGKGLFSDRDSTSKANFKENHEGDLAERPANGTSDVVAAGKGKACEDGVLDIQGKDETKKDSGIAEAPKEVEANASGKSKKKSNNSRKKKKHTTADPSKSGQESENSQTFGIMVSNNDAQSIHIDDDCRALAESNMRAVEKKVGCLIQEERNSHIELTARIFAVDKNKFMADNDKKGWEAHRKYILRQLALGNVQHMPKNISRFEFRIENYVGLGQWDMEKHCINDDSVAHAEKKTTVWEVCYPTALDPKQRVRSVFVNEVDAHNEALMVKPYANHIYKKFFKKHQRKVTKAKKSGANNQSIEEALGKKEDVVVIKKKDIVYRENIHVPKDHLWRLFIGSFREPINADPDKDPILDGSEAGGAVKPEQVKYFDDIGKAIVYFYKELAVPPKNLTNKIKVRLATEEDEKLREGQPSEDENDEVAQIRKMVEDPPKIYFRMENDDSWSACPNGILKDFDFLGRFAEGSSNDGRGVGLDMWRKTIDGDTINVNTQLFCLRLVNTKDIRQCFNASSISEKGFWHTSPKVEPWDETKPLLTTLEVNNVLRSLYPAHSSQPEEFDFVYNLFLMGPWTPDRIHQHAYHKVLEQSAHGLRRLREIATREPAGEEEQSLMIWDLRSLPRGQFPGLLTGRELD